MLLYVVNECLSIIPRQPSRLYGIPLPQQLLRRGRWRIAPGASGGARSRQPNIGQEPRAPVPARAAAGQLQAELRMERGGKDGLQQEIGTCLGKFGLSCLFESCLSDFQPNSPTKRSPSPQIQETASTPKPQMINPNLKKPSTFQLSIWNPVHLGSPPRSFSRRWHPHPPAPAAPPGRCWLPPAPLLRWGLLQQPGGWWRLRHQGPPLPRSPWGPGKVTGRARVWSHVWKKIIWTFPTLIEILDFFDEHVWEGILGDWIGWLGMGLEQTSPTCCAQMRPNILK